ncbi:MAG: hypothetical protein ABIG43_05060 [Chloroflexota bacterium]
MKLKSLFFLLCCCLIFLSACQYPVSRAITEGVIKVSDTPTLTETPTPTETHKPTSTPTATATETLTPTPTATPFLGFEDAFLYSAWNQGNQTIFIFRVTGVSSTFYGIVDGYPMTCEPHTDYPNTLVCVTDNYLFGSAYMTFGFYVDESMQQLLYSGEFYTGLAKENTPTKSFLAGLIWPKASFTADDISWAGDDTWCEQRGENVFCETEYRIYDGECYVGSSCYDDCGYYYSVDTIPQDGGDYTFSGPCLP